MILQAWTYRDGSIGGYKFWCPACEELHQYWTKDEKTGATVWKFNGDMEKPTFTPSLLRHARENKLRCHLSIADGQILFYNDSGHKLHGQCVNMVDIPEEWLL